jgi:sugar transferase (PEP-CTERM/EpsH1 system associated)
VIVRVILHLITELNVGGAEKALSRFLTRLDRDRFAPIVASLYDGDGLVAQEIRAQGIPVIDLGMEAKWRVDAFWRLYRLLVQSRPIILHTWMFHANVIGRVIGRLAKVPIIISSRRNVHIGKGWREVINRWTAPVADHLIAVCELARQVEIERTGVSPEHVTTIYNGVDAEQYSAANPQARAQIRQIFGIAADALLVGAVGRLHRQKGFRDLLAAFVEVREQIPAARLLLVGDGELRDELENQARSSGLSNGVVFAGIRSDIPRTLAGLDLFVLPSLWEGMPNAVLEAMATGLPVVSTAVGGTPEIIVDGVTGFLVPPRNPSALAGAITTLLQDAHLRRKMGQAGRRRTEQHFSLGETARQTQALYQTLLQEKGLA